MIDFETLQDKVVNAIRGLDISATDMREMIMEPWLELREGRR